MCGIAGYFGTRTIPDDRIQACLGLMHHRGPDSVNYEHFTNQSNRNAYLLFSRLSIIDLDPRANQPFHIGEKWIVFNGELYNYLERKNDLTSRGYEFRTRSDTEVMLMGIDNLSLKTLDQCEGMWAFAIYDEARGSLTLCRDRFGEKPLYLYRDGSGIYFGSEAKFIVGLLGHGLQINLDHVYRYMVNGYKSLYKNGQSFFKELGELLPASLLSIDANGNEKQIKYWEPAISVNESLSYEESVKQVREHLIRSVEYRLRADVPLAFCMSGGVDSNSLISIAKSVFDYDVHGFTILNTDGRYEEQGMVEQSVKELGIRHTSIPVDTRNFLPKLRSLVRHHDAPLYTISYYAHWMLMESIHKHGYRISVSGTGADELFTGYYDHHLAYLYEVRNNDELYRLSLKSWQDYIQPLVRNPYLIDPEQFLQKPGFRDHIYLDAEKFAGFLKVKWHEPFRENEYSSSLLRNRMLNEMFHESVPVILHEDDLNAMFFSIENRSPFLDRDLFEFSYSIPTKYLIQDARTKSVLRDAISGFAPQAVIDNRRKVGFNAPIYSFLDIHDSDVQYELLADSPIFEHVQREKIKELIMKPGLPNSESKFLFNFLNSKMFLEEFLN